MIVEPIKSSSGPQINLHLFSIALLLFIEKNCFPWNPFGAASEPIHEKLSYDIKHNILIIQFIFNF